MGRQSNDDPTVLHSSIALLQERFRQLQRVKEMREERELLRGFAVAETDPPPPQQPKWFTHPDLVRPSRPLSGPPAHRGDQRPEFRALETSLSIGFSMQSSNIRGETDVDTSLHL